MKRYLLFLAALLTWTALGQVTTVNLSFKSTNEMAAFTVTAYQTNLNATVTADDVKTGFSHWQFVPGDTTTAGTNAVVSTGVVGRWLKRSLVDNDLDYTFWSTNGVRFHAGAGTGYASKSMLRNRATAADAAPQLVDMTGTPYSPSTLGEGDLLTPTNVSAHAATVRSRLAISEISIVPYLPASPSSTDCSSALASAIAAAAANDVIVIPPGTYLVTNTVTIPKTLTIRGAGRDKTILNFVHAQGTEHKLFQVNTVAESAQAPGTAWPTGASNLVETALLAHNYIDIGSTNSVVLGRPYLVWDNDTAELQGGYRAEVVVPTWVTNGSTRIYLASPLSFDHKTNDTAKFVPVNNISWTIEDLAVTGPRTVGVGLISSAYTDSCTVRNVDVHNIVYDGSRFTYMSNLLIENCRFFGDTWNTAANQGYFFTWSVCVRSTARNNQMHNGQFTQISSSADCIFDGNTGWFCANPIVMHSYNRRCLVRNQINYAKNGAGDLEDRGWNNVYENLTSYTPYTSIAYQVLSATNIVLRNINIIMPTGVAPDTNTVYGGSIYLSGNTEITLDGWSVTGATTSDGVSLNGNLGNIVIQNGRYYSLSNSRYAISCTTAASTGSIFIKNVHSAQRLFYGGPFANGPTVISSCSASYRLDFAIDLTGTVDNNILEVTGTWGSNAASVGSAKWKNNTGMSLVTATDLNATSGNYTNIAPGLGSHQSCVYSGWTNQLAARTGLELIHAPSKKYIPPGQLLRIYNGCDGLIGGTATNLVIYENATAVYTFPTNTYMRWVEFRYLGTNFVTGTSRNWAINAADPALSVTTE